MSEATCRGSGEAPGRQHAQSTWRVLWGGTGLVRFSLMLSVGRPLRLCPLFVQWENEAQQEQVVGERQGCRSNALA